MMKLTREFGYRFHFRILHHLALASVIFMVFTMLLYLLMFNVITISSSWFVTFISVTYTFMVFYIGKTLIPMVNMNQGLCEIIIRLNEVRFDVQRLIANKHVPYYELTYLHENITTQMIIRYLKELEDG